jgi:cytochrome c5
VAKDAARRPCSIASNTRFHWNDPFQAPATKRCIFGGFRRAMAAFPRYCDCPSLRRTHLTTAFRSFIMLTRLAIIAGALSLAVFVTTAAGAGANPNRGKTLFRSTCKSCHVPDGGAKDLTPMSKTQAQWTRAFKTTIDPMVKRVQTKTGKALGPADLADIQLFLVSHAADSDQPETCGVK